MKAVIEAWFLFVCVIQFRITHTNRNHASIILKFDVPSIVVLFTFFIVVGDSSCCRIVFKSTFNVGVRPFSCDILSPVLHKGFSASVILYFTS